MHRESFHLTLDFVDRYLSRVTNLRALQNPYLIALAAIWISSKIEEYHTPKIGILLHYLGKFYEQTGVTDKYLKLMEEEMLSVLKMNLHPMTSIQWLGFYMQVMSLEGKNINGFSYFNVYF